MQRLDRRARLARPLLAFRPRQPSDASATDASLHARGKRGRAGRPAGASRYRPLREVRLLSSRGSRSRRCPLVRRRESSLQLHQRGSAKLLRLALGQWRSAPFTSGTASAPTRTTTTESGESAPRAGSRGDVAKRSSNGVGRRSLLPAQLPRPLLVRTHRAGAS
jgi:hypothetical protein